jgi:acyl carrier protein
MPETTVTPELIEKSMMEALATMGPEPDQITREAKLEDLEVDSLDLIELLQIAEERFGVEINPEDAKDVKTVGDALDLMIAHAK